MTRIAPTLLLGTVLAGPMFGQAQQPAARGEDAYRRNNVGVARLEQYNYADAATEFRGALELHPNLSIARLNLAIALLYDGQLEAAAQEAKTATERLPTSPQPYFILGLIARADNRPDAAAAAFERVIELDPTDAGARLHLGQVRLGQRHFAEAAKLFESALKAEPFNATAAYGLAQALTRSGDRARSEQAMASFQALRDNPAATTYATTYLEQGRYGEAIASTGLEPELIDRAAPSATFRDATASLLPADRSANGVSLADLDADGRIELLLARTDGVHVVRNEKGRFASTRAIAIADARAALVGDYDNDGSPDVAVLTSKSIALFRHDGGTYRDVTAQALPAIASAEVRTAAFVDSDHDGDLDLVVGPRLLRNNGAGKFEDVTTDAKLTGLQGLLALVPTDFDNRRDVDLLIVRSGAAPALFSNERNGTFVDVAADVGLPQETSYAAVATGDINKDMAPDYFFARADGEGVFAVSGPVGRFTRVAAPAGTADTRAALLLDYDNDGLLDLLVVTPGGPKLWRGLGAEWSDVTTQALAALKPGAGNLEAVALNAADLDGDGDHDVVARLASGDVRLWWNEGGNRRPSARVQLAARVSNRDGVGSKVELRAGSLRGRVETFSTTPAVAPADIVFGLGSRAKPDVIRVLWPAGILQAETDVTVPLMKVEELDRKPSSCPFLYTWNGRTFEFVTDFLGGGELGYWMGPGVRSVPDPDEYVRITGEQLRPRNGSYELRITNELEEALFVDRVQLVAVAHPIGVEVHPNEGLRSPGKREPFTLYTAREGRPPLRAVDQTGRDVLERVAARDRRYVDGFRLESIQGYAEEHWVAFEIGDPDPSSPRRSAPEAREAGPRQSVPEMREGGPRRSAPEMREGGPRRSAPEMHEGGPRQSVSEMREGGPRRSAPAMREGGPRPSVSEMREGGPRRSVSEMREGGPRRSAPEMHEGGPRQSVPEMREGGQRRSALEMREGGPRRSAPEIHEGGRRRTVLEAREGGPRRKAPDIRKGGSLPRRSESATTREGGRVLLLLTGWTDYAFSSDNVAAHQAGLALRPPELQARDANGQWRTVIAEVGMPVGRPQTVVVDLTPHARGGAREFRILTTMRVYWDQILVDTSAPVETTMTRVDPTSAVLRWRGFSAEVRPDGQEPASYDYDRVEPTAPWKLMPGRYTRAGDVLPLLTAVDDRFTIAAPGDEIAVSFPAEALPPLPDGWTRTFLLYADGFSKEMNLHSSSPDALEPLPFHAMTAYPYAPPERYPDTPAHRRYIEEYNTRTIGRSLPPLERTR